MRCVVHPSTAGIMKTGMFFLCLFVLSVFAPVSGQTTIDTPIRFSHVNRDRDAMGKLYNGRCSFRQANILRDGPNREIANRAN
jgi:hypothetical protein